MEMIRKRIRIGSYERMYGLVAFVVNTNSGVKLCKLETRRRINSYA